MFKYNFALFQWKQDFFFYKLIPVCETFQEPFQQEDFQVISTSDHFKQMINCCHVTKIENQSKMIN